MPEVSYRLDGSDTLTLTVLRGPGKVEFRFTPVDPVEFNQLKLNVFSGARFLACLDFVADPYRKGSAELRDRCLKHAGGFTMDDD